MNDTAKFDDAFVEHARNGEQLTEALDDASILRPIDAEVVKSMPSGALRMLGQIAYRFIIFKDTLGERILPGPPQFAEEPLLDSTPFQQKPRRLERLGAMPSADTWRQLV